MSNSSYSGRCRRFAFIFVLLLPGVGIADTVSTGFEDDPDGDFTIGTSPFTANFTGGEAQTVGNGALYHSGLHSWHISPGSTGTVTFETAASNVDFWYREANNAGPSEARVIDTDGVVTATVAGTTVFQNVVVTRNAGETLIARVEVENMGNSNDIHGHAESQTSCLESGEA